jgi:hypothetical protein
MPVNLSRENRTLGNEDFSHVYSGSEGMFEGKVLGVPKEGFRMTTQGILKLRNLVPDYGPVEFKGAFGGELCFCRHKSHPYL